MSSSINSAHAHCSTQNRAVSLEQTEGQCRDRHSCSDDACPLASEFQKDRFSRTLNMLAASIGQGLSEPHGN
jgi:hypothetical protein